MVFRMKIGTITKPSTSFHSVDKTQFVFNKDLKNTWQLKTLKKITKIMTNPILLDWSRNWRSERTRDTVNWIAKRKIPFIAIFVFFYLDKVTVDELHIAHKSIIFRSEFYALTHIHRQTIKKVIQKQTQSVGTLAAATAAVTVLDFVQWEKAMFASMRCVHVYWNENKWMRFSKSDEKREKIDYDADDYNNTTNHSNDSDYEVRRIRSGDGIQL